MKRARKPFLGVIISEEMADIVRGVGVAIDPIPLADNRFYPTSDMKAYLADWLALHQDSLRAIEMFGIGMKKIHGSQKAPSKASRAEAILCEGLAAH